MLEKSPSEGLMLYDEQRAKIMSLLKTAEMLANDLHEDTLAYLIERAIDECQASFLPRGQPPYPAG